MAVKSRVVQNQPQQKPNDKQTVNIKKGQIKTPVAQPSSICPSRLDHLVHPSIHPCVHLHNPSFPLPFPSKQNKSPQPANLTIFRSSRIPGIASISPSTHFPLERREKKTPPPITLTGPPRIIYTDNGVSRSSLAHYTTPLKQDAATQDERQ